MWPLVIVFASLFGLIIGSFLNVCIYRLPRKESIVRPRSHCPGCKRIIRWYENIPVLSFIFLKGKCRHCDRPISLRYPIVEILTALLSVAIAIHFRSLALYVAFFLLLSAPLMVITFIDLEHLMIPDVISLPGIVAGVIVHLYIGPGTSKSLLLDSFLGILLGGGVLFLLSWIYERFRGRIGLGFGDVKLAAMLGAFFGWRAIIFLLLIGSLLGTITGLTYIIICRRGLKQAIPFGPFLSLAAWLYLFYGSEILNWYLSFTKSLYEMV